MMDDILAVPAPLDPSTAVTATERELKEMRAMFDAYRNLLNLGWREVMYAPRDWSPLEVIEPGSTGIHRATRDEDGDFWVFDGDSWPSDPVLFRVAKYSGKEKE